MLVVAEQLRRPVEGGIGTYARGLLGALAPLGVDVHLWASRAPGAGPDPLGALGRVVTSPLPAPGARLAQRCTSTPRGASAPSNPRA